MGNKGDTVDMQATVKIVPLVLAAVRLAQRNEIAAHGLKQICRIPGAWGPVY